MSSPSDGHGRAMVEWLVPWLKTGAIGGWMQPCILPSQQAWLRIVMSFLTLHSWLEFNVGKS